MSTSTESTQDLFRELQELLDRPVGRETKPPVPRRPTPSLATAEAVFARMLEREEESLLHRVEELREERSILEALSSNLLMLQTAQGDAGVTVLEGKTEVVAALESAAVRARKEILSLHPGAPLPADMLAESMERNQQVLDRGVAMRSIHLEAMLRIPYGRAHLRNLQDAGAEVRVAPVLPLRLIIVDEILGYAAMAPRDGRFAALEFKGPDVVHVLLQIFDHCWVHGAMVSTGEQPASRKAKLVAEPEPEPAAPESAEPELGDRERALIRMLAEGHKDEAIARCLGVSSRTLRRLMTEVMDMLQAESRFQAGARAMARGWLDQF